MNLALYIHVPYCEEKCPYCDFNSYPNKGRVNKDFIPALKKEISLQRRSLDQHRIVSIFFGGGTPTVFSADALTDIVNYCYKIFSIEADCEITIEANPGTVHCEYLKVLRENNFNRLSLGCQSFDDRLLKKIGRIHKSHEIHQSISAAKNAGFKNVSLDLMFGLPEQTIELWKETLQEAIQLKPTHLSVYNLTIEQNTPFYDQLQKGEITLPSEDLQLNMYEEAIEYLSKNGYIHYEISNFALKGYECLHNKVYWNNNEYIGFGPGAASYLNGTRSVNVLSPDEYVKILLDKKEIPFFQKETLYDRKRMGETLMLGLRMLKGIDLHDFENRFGKSLDSEFGEKIKKLHDEHLLVYGDNDRLKLTHKGILYSNEVFVELV